MKKLIILSMLLIAAIGARGQTATVKNVDSAINANINTQAMINATAKLTYYGVTQAQITAIINSIPNYVVTQVGALKFGTPPVVVTPPPPSSGTKIVGGTLTTNLVRSNEKGKRYSFLSFNSGNKQTVQLLFTNCTNDTVEYCGFANTTAISARFVNCTGIVFRYNYGTNTNFLVRFEQCKGVICNSNQGLNLNGPEPIYNKNFAHWIQAVDCTGHQEYNDNRFENIKGVAKHPHDHMTFVNCFGGANDPIQIERNWLRGGQQTPYPGTGDKGGGIMAPDGKGGNYIVKDNICDNCGTAGYQAVGSGGYNVVVDGNIFFNDNIAPSAADGISVQQGKTNFTISNNRVWWINKNGNAGDKFTGGETMYWWGGPNVTPSSIGVTLVNNKSDNTLTHDILPKTIITYSMKL